MSFANHGGNEDSTCLAPGLGVVPDAPPAPCAPASAHSKVRDGEGTGIHPLHDHIPVLTGAHQEPAAAPLNQDFFKLLWIHDSWRRDWYLWIVTIF